MKLYQVDAFTGELFAGNPAAVCLPDRWPEEKTMQLIAAENNLAETAFVVPSGRGYEIRWFTPTVEVALCGHATLATGYVLHSELGVPEDKLVFRSKSGELRVKIDGDLFVLDFPADEPVLVAAPEPMKGAFRYEPSEVLRGVSNYVAVLQSEAQVRDCGADLNRIALLDSDGVIVTAPGEEVDFVSRFFAPRIGIPEDPVTGAAHTTLTPYWAKRLGRKELSAAQLSPRGGHLRCLHRGERVEIGGRAVLYLKGEIFV